MPDMWNHIYFLPLNSSAHSVVTTQAQPAKHCPVRLKRKGPRWEQADRPRTKRRYGLQDTGFRDASTANIELM